MLQRQSLMSSLIASSLVWWKLLSAYSLCFVVNNITGQVPLDSIQGRLREIVLVNDTMQSGLFKTRIAGVMVSALVVDGDTLYVVDIDNLTISSPRRFTSTEDYQRYMRYKRYAASVFPFAKEAIRIFREAEYVTATMKKKKRKKYLKELSKELQQEFEEPLKGLSKTQGKILVKMIEKELEMPMFDLIKMTQGSMKAFYWNHSSKLYGYRLKEEYRVGENVILDMVLKDLDISYDLPQKKKSNEYDE